MKKNIPITENLKRLKTYPKLTILLNDSQVVNLLKNEEIVRLHNENEEKNKKVNEVMDDEGIVFDIKRSPKITERDRMRDSVIFVKEIFESQLKANYIYSYNNKISISGDIDTLSYTISEFIESYLSEKQK